MKLLAGNTIDDIKLTTTIGHIVTCPSCGGTLSLHNQGTLDLILLQDAARYCDDIIDALRLFTAEIERFLATKMTYHKLYRHGTDSPYQEVEDEIQKTMLGDSSAVTDVTGNAIPPSSHLSPSGELPPETFGFVIAERLLKDLDKHGLTGKINSLPPLPPKGEKPDRALVEKYGRLVLGEVLEPKEFGCVLDLITVQEPICLFLMNSDAASQFESVARAIVSRVCPSLAKLHTYIEDNMGCLEPQQQNVFRESLARTRKLLAILHGHNFPEFASTFKGESERTIAAELCSEKYHLPEQPFVSGDLVSRILRSVMFLSRPHGGICDRLSNYLKQLWCFSKSLFGRGSEPVAFPFEWLEELGKTFTVRCAHAVKEPEEFDVETAADGITREQNRYRNRLRKIYHSFFPSPDETPLRRYVKCNWIPSVARTHSILLVGSPGTGKSQICNTGLSVLRSNSLSLGFRTSNQDSFSSVKLAALKREYREGLLKEPTKQNRDWKIELVGVRNDPERRLRVAVIDPTGESINTVAQGTGVDPDLRRLLVNCETVVFLYDLWSDSDFNDALRSANREPFANALADALEAERDRDKRGGFFTQPSEILQKLIDLLKELRGGDQGLREINFVCVIPKADTFIAPGLVTAEKHFFLTDVARKLHEQNLLIPSLRTNNSSSAARFESIAGAGTKYCERDGDVVRRQLEMLSQVSAWTRDALKKLGDVIPDDGQKQLRQAQTDKIDHGVIEFLEQRFNKVFFLPVSALGEVPTPDQRTARKLKSAPTSMLAEYVFLLPMLLSLEADSMAEHSKNSNVPTTVSDDKKPQPSHNLSTPVASPQSDVRSVKAR